MRKFCIWSLVALLLVIHQDNWFWADSTLVFGFMPVGLLYHAGISVAAACLWFAAIVLIWPTGIDTTDPIDQQILQEKTEASEV
jgi:hypothetical protein